MIRVSLRNFRGCERADLEVAPVALAAGNNAAGKSSLVQAVGAALSGSTLVIDGINKATAGLLVKAGAAVATVSLAGDDGDVQVTWPACNVVTEGKPPAASVWATGLDSLPLVPVRERAAVLARYLKADPTKDDLAAAFADAGFADTAAGAFWQQIDEQGWDAVVLARRDRGAELKGAWRQVTTQNWGSRVAKIWQPAAWDEALAGMTEEQLGAAAETAHRGQDAAIAAAAVSAANRADLEREVSELDARKDSLRAAEAAADRLGEALDAAKTARGELPAAPKSSGIPCPHCGAFVAIERVDLATTRLVPVETLPENELKARRIAIAGADGAIERVHAEYQAAAREVERVRYSMQASLDARRRLDALPAPSGGGGGPDVAAARAALDAAVGRIAAWRQKRDADDLARRIAGNEALLAILAPDGLRAQKLRRVLDAWNEGPLAGFAEAAGWAAVTVAADLAILYGGRPYPLLSTSEQYRARAVLAAAMAAIDGSAMLVFDAADVLDAPQRSGLFGLIEEADCPALVAMTATRRDQVPDLAALGIGKSFWLDRGICTELYIGAARTAPPQSTEAA